MLASIQLLRLRAHGHPKPASFAKRSEQAAYLVVLQPAQYVTQCQSTVHGGEVQSRQVFNQPTLRDNIAALGAMQIDHVRAGRRC